MLFEVQVKKLNNGYLVRVSYMGSVEKETFYQHLGEVYTAAKLELNNYLGES